MCRYASMIIKSLTAILLPQEHLPDKSYSTLLFDGERLLSMFYEPIYDSALHVYFSAAVFQPSCELFGRMSGDSKDGGQLVSERHSGWSPLLKSMTGHSGPVRAVAISADGTHIVSGSDDSTVRVWEMESGRVAAMLQGHSDRVNAVAISADGTRIVSGSYDSTVRVWEMESGREVATLQGHSGPVLAVAISADGQIITSRDSSDNTRTWISGQDFPSHPTFSLDTCQSWPLGRNPAVRFAVDQSGWLIANSMRLCWVPVDRRPSYNGIVWSGSKVVIGSQGGVVTILDVGHQLAYHTSLSRV
jgi:WD40 repeat protein